MKNLLSIVFVAFLFSASAQNDTLREDNLRNIADTLFMNLDQNYYGESLLNRSFSSNKIIKQQIKGNYNQTHSVNDFLNIYSDVALSYVDSTYMMNSEQAAHCIDSIFRTNEQSTTKDELIQPFGLLYHYVSYIDSTKFTEDNFSAENHSYVPLISENQLYQESLIKSGALLEFYPESGYNTGKLQYSPSLISHSPDIDNMSLRIDVGNGFVNFDESNSLISYDRTRDSLVGQVEVSFEKNDAVLKDTLSCYLTTQGEKRVATKGVTDYLWDWTGTFLENNATLFKPVEYKYGVKQGCGNSSETFRRPIIIIPPYRPSIQPVSLNGYYNQFDFKSLISSLSNMGYDVIFVKQSPGNASLEDAGETLAKFIDYVNEKKKIDYPDESWENIVMGFSMGGQIARYALKKMEHDHMSSSSSKHHHTRLYIPYDSPHLGANIPMFTQFVYKDLTSSASIFAWLAYISLTDAASRDMSATHVNGSVPSIFYVNGMKVYSYDPSPHVSREAFVDALHNDFNHQFTPLNDLRRSYPTFSRNIAISTGRNNQDYNDEFSLQPGKLLFSQNAIDVDLLGGLKSRYTRLHASEYKYGHTAFRNKVKLLTLLVPITLRDHDYRINYGLEWDMAQGGYKDEFYDKFPTGAVSILRLKASGFGQKEYNNHMSFLPLVSALGINPNIWQNNDLFFDLREEGLMYQEFDFDVGLDESEIFGFPHLAHPNNHFNITPFESVYADPQTYEHIKMQKSVEEDDLDEDFLVYTRDFILNEVEADVVALQNKVIGKNHNQTIPNYKYSAWYKAYNRIEIGHKVTPKTDPGDYIIEATGDITVYAQDSVIIKSGFHAQPGSNFHAFTHYDGCSRPRGKSKSSAQNEGTTNVSKEISRSSIVNNTQSKTKFGNSVVVYPNPNNGKFKIVIPGDQVGGKYSIVNNSGIVLREGTFYEHNEKTFDLPNGIYYFQWIYGGELEIKKIIVL